MIMARRPGEYRAFYYAEIFLSLFLAIRMRKSYTDKGSIFE